MFNRSRLSEKERIDVLEYISFQIKSGSSYKKALQRYMDADRKKRVVEAVEIAMESIGLGDKPADALLASGLITEIEYTLIANADNLFEAIAGIVAMAKTRIKSSGTLKKSVQVWVGIILLLLLLIPYFRDSIVLIYTNIAEMAVMASGEKAVVELPFIVKYWWASFVIAGAALGSYLIVVKALNWVYKHHARLYYFIFRHILHRDIAIVFTAIRHMRGSMSLSNAYRSLAKSAPNSYWTNLFSSVSENLNNGGKASDVFAYQVGIIPLEVVHCVVDAEDTREEGVYFQKAIDLSLNRHDEIQSFIQVSIPIVFQVLAYVVVGIIAIGFLRDMSDQGILQVLAQIH